MAGKSSSGPWRRLPRSSPGSRAMRTSKKYSSAPPMPTRRRRAGEGQVEDGRWKMADERAGARAFPFHLLSSICHLRPMIAALLYLQYHSIKNRIVMRVKRLKQPKYLLGGIVGAAYFYFFFFRRLGGAPGQPQSWALWTGPGDPVLYESLGALVLLAIVLLAWLVPHERAALVFTEAEVAFLFPAPISRRGLIHFKLLRSQTAILFTTLLLTLVTRRMGGNAWIRAAGWWLVLSTLNLHFLGSSFARTMLLERGISNWQRRLGILALMLMLAGVVLVWAWRTMPAFSLSQFEDFEAVKNYFVQALASGPAPFLLYPFRLVVRPYLTASPPAFLLAAIPAVLIMLLHYVWA